MEISAISAVVQKANSKLAQFLRQLEEEEGVLQIGKQKPKPIDEKKHLPTGSNRWSAEVDFTVPTCLVDIGLVDRPRTANGGTSFHFSYRTISKEVEPTINGVPVGDIFGSKKTKQPALEHAQYIERDGAAEVSRGLQHADYIERPEAVEAIDPTALASQVDEPRLTIDGGRQTHGDDGHPNGILSVFSNISDDPFERQEYWRAIERCERVPRSHTFHFYPDSSPRWWAAVEHSEQLEPAFKDHLCDVAEQYRQYQETPTANDEAKAPFIPPAYPPKRSKLRMTAEEAGRLLEQAAGLPGFDFSKPPIKFKSGRGGRIQLRFVAELPVEVSAEDRAIIARTFCDRLAALETRADADGINHEVGLMYTAVIHAPDAHNDRRNYHFHIVAHDRPARYLDDEGMWDFEVKESYYKNRKWRIRFPYRQNKIGSVARAGNGADYDRSGRNFVPAMRREFAEITNSVLEARGINRRYDPRRYTEMGITREPTKHLGTRAAALEAIGVVTSVGEHNAIAIWKDALHDIDRHARDVDRSYRADLMRFAKLLSETASMYSHLPAHIELQSLLAERRKVVGSLAEDSREIMAFTLSEAKAKSRAVRTRQTCLTYLAEIEDGVADGSTRTMMFSIKARLCDAQKHIEKIDAVLAPHRDALAEAVLDIETRESRLAKIDGLMERLALNLQNTINVQKQREITVSDTEPLAVQPENKPGNSRSKECNEIGSGAGNPPISEAEAVTEPAHGPEYAIERDVTDKAAEIAGAGPVTVDSQPVTERTPQPQDLTQAKKKKRKKATKKPEPHTPEVSEPLDPAIPAHKQPVKPEVAAPDFDPVEPNKDAPRPVGERVSEPIAVDADTSKTVQSEYLGAKQKSEVVAPRSQDGESRAETSKEGSLARSRPKSTELQDWDTLIARIMKDRIPIKRETTASGYDRYTVPALDEKDQATLNIRRFSYRTPFRLEPIYKGQQQEIKRLARWIKEHGQDPEKLIIEGRIAKLGDVRPAVTTLMRNWGRHPDILTAVREVNARRIREAKAQSTKAEMTKVVRSPRRSEEKATLRNDAVKKYPDPDVIYTKAVAVFVRLLQDSATEEILREAAENIWDCPKGREDVYRYGRELTAAYAKHVDGLEQRRGITRGDGRKGRS